MTINLFDHEELGDIQPLKDILASPIFDRLDLQGQIKYIVNENSRLKAMITDIKDELNARIAQLTAERDEWKNKFTDALACNGRLVEQVEQLTAERNKLAEAFGLMTTLKPTMVVDSTHPVEMALEVSEYITQLTAELDEWKKKVEELTEQLEAQETISEIQQMALQAKKARFGELQMRGELSDAEINELGAQEAEKRGEK